MPIISHRRSRTVRGLTIATALLLSAVAVSQASYSAFSATTDNKANSFDTGKLTLSNDKSSALFVASNLMPGNTDNKVITITSKGSLVGGVKLYASDGTTASTDADLGKYLKLTIEEGTVSGAAFTPERNDAIYTGTLADLIATKTSYSNGVGHWMTTGNTSGETKSYRITYTLSSTAPNSVQGKTSKVSLNWEIQAGR